MEQRLIAQVYVEKAIYAIDKPFSYHVPKELRETLKRGCRVLVPFGGSNRKVQGLVVEVCPENMPNPKLKPVAAQLDREPLISEEMFGVIEFLVSHTFCTWYEAVRAVLPTGANVGVTEFYRLTRPLEASELEALPRGERRLVEFLRTAKSSRELNAFLDVRQNPAKTAVVKSLLSKGIIAAEDRVRQRVSPRTVRMVRLSEGFDPETESLTKKQREVAELLAKVGTSMPKELCYLCGVTEAVLRTLAKRGAVSYYDQEVEDLPADGVPATQNLAEVTLSEDQQAACDGIWELVEEDRANAALLYGVTGSGKTQVYIKLIERVIARGRTAMMLVPEIALTPQLVAKFRALFGGVVAVIHSSLSPGERLEEDKRIRAGQASIVIGTRSAVFAPLENLGLIIMDEEGEGSYKSDSSPRYHARDVAKLRCVQHRATLLLGSATPSIDSYYRAQNGTYSLFTLEDRYADANLPSVYLVDMLEEQRKKNTSPLSEILQEQLALNLENREQSILLINRRGYNTFATCMQCGEVITCPSCSVAMTYHRANGYLMCHYCGHTERFTSKCPSCGGNYLKLTGTGTQKLEDELSLILPKARLLRMDTDTTYSKYAYEKNFDAFHRGEYDILLGTQMIAKGLDFPNVTLVGVLAADSGLYSTDYRASERVFSLITQVVGRSGRSGKAGRAYIQTYDPENPVINFAAHQDYRAFYEDEIVSRKAMIYPPFCDIVTLGFASPDEEAAQAAALRASEILRETASRAEHVALKVMGVAPASIYRISGKYRYRIVVKCRLNPALRAVFAEVLALCGKERIASGVTITADVNGEMT